MNRILVFTALMSGLMFLRIGLASPPEQAAPSRADRVVKTDAEWRAALSPEEYRILRQAGTERAFTGDFWNDKKPGVYTCGACDLELFASEDKFDSGTGWPSYTRPIAEDRVDTHSDFAYGMMRTEVVCARCGGHLGHVFPDGPKPTGLRYCINGNALDKKEPAKKAAPTSSPAAQ